MNDTHANYVDVCKFANISGVAEKGQFENMFDFECVHTYGANQMQ